MKEVQEVLDRMIEYRGDRGLLITGIGFRGFGI
jgi:hypothetical protein